MVTILVDTSVWSDYMKTKNDELAKLLASDLVVTHPLIIGEIACGTPHDRKPMIVMLNELKQTRQPSIKDVLSFIENEKLYGHGCGIVDITILTACLVTPNTKIWTLDKRLKALADRFNVMYQPTLH